MEQLWEMDDHVVSLSALWNPGVLQIIPSSLQSNRSCGLSHLYYGVQLTTEAGCHRIAMLGELNREVYQIVIKWIIFWSQLQSITFFPVYYTPLESLLWSFCWPDLLLWYLAGVSACVKWLHHGHSALCQCTRQCAPRSAPSLAQQCAPEGFCTRAAVHQHCPCRPPTTLRKLTNSAKA